MLLAKHRRLNKFGRSILRILCNGGTTELTRRIPNCFTSNTRKALLKLVTQGKLQCHVGYQSSDFQEVAKPNKYWCEHRTAGMRRLPKGNTGQRNTLHTSATGLRQIVQGGDASVHMRSAKTASEAIVVLKNRLQQGIAIDLYMYVEVLKQCLVQKDIVVAKQVQDCIIESGMEQNVYVANNLLNVYIKCGRLEDARQVFDELDKKDVFSWNAMIGGYAEHNCAKNAMEFFKQMREEGVQPNEITYLSILKACASLSTLKWGEEIHANIRHGGFESDVRVGTALIKMYAKCGSIKEARKTFDKLGSRNVITWNVMIGAYAKSSCGEEAYQLLLQMKREGFESNAITFLSILNACASTGALEWVKEVHRQVVEAGFESDLRLGNALVHMYAKSGSIDDARLVFDRMKERNVRTWNVMIGGLAQHGSEREAYDLFLRMRQEGFKPDAFTCASILNACPSAEALEWVKEVHRHALEAGLESDLRVGNALVHMYAKSGSMDDARLVFGRMDERNVVTWNIMIGGLAQHGCGHEAYELFLRMQQEGIKANVTTYVSILNASASGGSLEWVREVHNYALEAELESNLRVGNALVHMYAKSGSMDDAQLVFDRMDERDVVTWNIMIGGLVQHGCGHEAYQLFLRMQQEGFEPNVTTYVSILNASASGGSLEWVREVHSHAVKAGLKSDLRVCNALIHMYAKSGSMDDARLVFDKMDERDLVTWNVIIGAYAGSGSGVEAYKLFLQMIQEGFKPDPITYVNILNHCASVGALEWVKEVHNHALKSGLESNVWVGNAFVHMYAKSGSIEDAQLVFDKMDERDLVTWNVMIGGLAQHGCGLEALEVFKKMIAASVKPDEYSFVAMLSACSHAGLVDEGRRLFMAMSQDYGIEPTVMHCNCLVDLLGRAGELEEAKLFIDNMRVEPNEATWGALLGACRSYVNVGLGELAAKERFKLIPKDAATYVLLSNIYAAAEKWEDVSLVRTMMRERGVCKEPGRSWIEVDNKIHAFVVGDTSHPEAKEIYAELSRLTEKIKALGYLPDTSLVLHNIDEKDKEFSICSHSEKLAIVYGLIHTPSSKQIRVFKNLRVCSDCHTATKLISKVSRKEIVVRDANRFHHFKNGVCSCKDYW